MENKFDTSVLFTNKEKHQGKTPQDDFKIVTPKKPLLSITRGYKYNKSYQTLCPISKYQPTVELLPQYLIGFIL